MVDGETGLSFGARLIALPLYKDRGRRRSERPLIEIEKPSEIDPQMTEGEVL
jgi:hypothetical protein